LLNDKRREHSSLRPRTARAHYGASPEPPYQRGRCFGADGVLLLREAVSRQPSHDKGTWRGLGRCGGKVSKPSQVFPSWRYNPRKAMTKLLTLLLLLGFVRAQPAFEVASVKPAKNPSKVRGGCHGIDSTYTASQIASAPPLGRCVISDARLGHLIQIAYRLQIKGGPDWVQLGEDRFNVDAKVEDPTKVTEDQLLQMLQGLLAERFSLKLHNESKDVQGFALVVGKTKMKPSMDDEMTMSFGGARKPMPGVPINLTARKFSMPRLAAFLGAFGRPVMDKTGLAGDYDFTLAWDETNGPSLTTALQEQLGLKFEPEKVPVTILVIDSAQKPAEN
jgi:uncharacterized protein (TIGR03435 family)